jgi:hypothetical protein
VINKGKGYKETEFIKKCSNNIDCSEEEHALNRRSEFIIINENETPESVRKMIAERVKQQNAKRKSTSVARTDQNIT